MDSHPQPRGVQKGEAVSDMEASESQRGAVDYLVTRKSNLLGILSVMCDLRYEI